MDPKPILFGYELVGCVNGAQAALRIEGSVVRHEVQFETEVTSPGEPLLWDEQVLGLAAIDPIALLSLDPDTFRRDAAPEVFRVESGLFDEGEKAVGRFFLSGCWGVEKERIAIRAQLVEEWLNFEPLEWVTHVGLSSPMSLLSAEKGKVVSTRTWAAGTSRGNSYSGVSMLRGGLPEVDQEMGDRVLRVRWAEVAGGEASEGRALRAYRVAVEGYARP